MGSMSEGGVIAQGYLAVSDDKVFVATGRSVPAVFDRQTGEFLYFHLSRYGGKTPKGVGGGDIVATDGVFFNSGFAFDTESGIKHKLLGKSKWWGSATYFGYDKGWMGEGVLDSNRVICVVPDGFVRSEGPMIYGSTLGYTTYSSTREAESYFYTERAESILKDDPTELKIRVEPKHRKELIENAPTMKDKWEIETNVKDHIESLIVAGDTVVVGTSGRVILVDRKSKRIGKEFEVDGIVYGLAVSDGRLYASTGKGTIYCFGGKSGGKTPVEVKPKEAKNPYTDERFNNAADEIIKQTGITKGYAVDLDCGDGSFAYAIAKKTQLYVIALAEDDATVAKARKMLDRAGVYGTRVQVLRRDKQSTYLPRYFANLIVSSKEIDGKSSSVPDEEIKRVQRPYGGTVCRGKTGCSSSSRRTNLYGDGQWTHPLGDAGNSLYSGDKIVKGPLGLFWYEDEEMVNIDRHGKNPAPLFYEGVMLQLGRDAIKGVDAYNGTILWQVELEGVLAGMTGGTGVGATASGNSYCIADGVAYVAYKDSCVRLDVFSGEEIGKFELPYDFRRAGTWGYVGVLDGFLVGSVAREDHIVKSQHGNGGLQNQLPMEKMFVESRAVFAVDAASGEVKWIYRPKSSIRNNSIALGGGKVFFVDRPVAKMDSMLKTDIAMMRSENKAVPKHSTGKLLALTLASGELVWGDDDNVFGTTMAYNGEHDVLVMSYNNVGRSLPSDSGSNGARAYRGGDGKRLWENAGLSVGRCVMLGETLWSYGAYDLLTGKQRLDGNRPWKMKGTGIGCGVWVGSDNILLRRSGTIGYYDLEQDDGWVDNYGGIRSGCWINMLPVGGIVLAPEDTQGCRCSYQNQASIALIERGTYRPQIKPVAGQANFKQRTNVGREVVFKDAMKLEIVYGDKGSELRYTTDGSFATEDSPLYSGPITIDKTTHVAAAAFKDGRKVSIRDPEIFLKLSESEFDKFGNMPNKLKEDKIAKIAKQRNNRKNNK
jgi:hypothetical protein